jgi:hypothetical protein
MATLESNNMPSITAPQQLVGPVHQHNGWTTRGEKLVRYWQEECRLYAWIYEQNATYYSRLNRSLGIASIALSAITGTTLFNQSASDPGETSSSILIGLGVSSIASTILSGLKELFDLNSLITQNTNAARENSSIVMDIDEQMNIDRADRIDGREFLKSIKDRKNALIQNGPIIPSRQWKQVHKKIQSKEQLGFLNREVFNEYLEQSVDINKLQFGLSGTNIANPQFAAGQAIDYGTPSSNSSGIPGAISIDMTGAAQQQQISKRAPLPEKLAFYGGPRQQILMTTPAIPTDTTIQDLETEMVNIQPRSAARKACLENQYALEKLLTKSGELKNKDRQQIQALREKAREYQDAYQKLTNSRYGDYTSIISCDNHRAAKILIAYRDGHISEPELFRMIQLDLMEIDREALQEELRLNTLITLSRQELDILSKPQPQREPINQPEGVYRFISTQPTNNNSLPSNSNIPSTTSNYTSRYPFRKNLPDFLTSTDPELIDINNHIVLNNQKIDSLEQKISLANQKLVELKKELVDTRTILDSQAEIPDDRKKEILTLIQELEMNIRDLVESQNGWEQELESTKCVQEQLSAEYTQRSQPTDSIITAKSIQTNLTTYSPTRTVDTCFRQTPTSVVSNAGIQYPQPEQNNTRRPSSTVPSDDEFIENLINDNLCSQKLQDIIKPIPTSPSNQSTQLSQIFSPSSITKSPKRTSSKYEAQMRYQTSRVPYK